MFIAADHSSMATLAIKAKLESLGLLPLTRRDVSNILVNPFVEKFQALREFTKAEVGVNEDGSRGMKPDDLEKLVQGVSVRCAEISCKVRHFELLYTVADIGFCRATYSRSSALHFLLQKVQSVEPF